MAPASSQRRLTVLVRLILVIPHIVVLFFVEIAAALLAFLGWWGALFMGRLPDFATSYLTGFVRWNARVTAYSLLLTDAYPPFTFGDRPDYPVRIATTRERLNRFAVFFRIILVFPASTVNMVLSYGSITIVPLVVWLIALVTGKVPDSLHLAYTAVLRFQVRFACYQLLLTPTYPVRGLLGDGPALPPPAATPPVPGRPYDYPGGDWAPGYPAAGYGTPGYGTPGYGQGGYTGPGQDSPSYGAPYAAPGPYSPAPYAPGQYAPAPFAPTPDDPRRWQVNLTGAAKGLMIFFLVLGSVVPSVYFGAGFSHGLNTARNVATANNAITAISNADSTLITETNRLQLAQQACNGQLSCVQKNDRKVAADFSTFASVVQATPEPSGAVAAANKVHADAARVAQEFTQLSQASGLAQYQNLYDGNAFQRSLNQFNADYKTLGTTLGTVGS